LPRVGGGKRVGLDWEAAGCGRARIGWAGWRGRAWGHANGLETSHGRESRVTLGAVGCSSWKRDEKKAGRDGPARAGGGGAAEGFGGSDLRHIKNGGGGLPTLPRGLEMDAGGYGPDDAKDLRVNGFLPAAFARGEEGGNWGTGFPQSVRKRTGKYGPGRAAGSGCRRVTLTSRSRTWCWQPGFCGPAAPGRGAIPAGLKAFTGGWDMTLDQGGDRRGFRVREGPTSELTPQGGFARLE